MELKLGIMTPQELAEWFGVGKRYYAKERKAKLKELEQYCIFVEVPYKGIEVQEIFTPVYIKSGKKLIEQKVEKMWLPGTANTPINLGKQIYKLDAEVRARVTEDTTIQCVNGWKLENYGTSRRCKKGKRPGKRGSSSSETVKVRILPDGTKEYTRLTSEERAARGRLYGEIFQTPDDWEKEQKLDINEEYNSMPEGPEREEWKKDALGELALEVEKREGVTSAEKWNEFNARSLELVGPTERAIVLEDGRFFACAENVAYYAELDMMLKQKKSMEKSQETT